MGGVGVVWKSGGGSGGVRVVWEKWCGGISDNYIHPLINTSHLRSSSANVDYVPITRALTFSGAVSSITFTVDLLDDKTVESLETFSVVLQSSDPAVDNTPARFATIEIVDNHSE